MNKEISQKQLEEKRAREAILRMIGGSPEKDQMTVPLAPISEKLQEKSKTSFSSSPFPDDSPKEQPTNISISSPENQIPDLPDISDEKERIVETPLDEMSQRNTETKLSAMNEGYQLSHPYDLKEPAPPRVPTPEEDDYSSDGFEEDATPTKSQNRYEETFGHESERFDSNPLEETKEVFPKHSFVKENPESSFALQAPEPSFIQEVPEPSFTQEEFPTPNTKDPMKEFESIQNMA